MITNRRFWILAAIIFGLLFILDLAHFLFWSLT